MFLNISSKSWQVWSTRQYLINYYYSSYTSCLWDLWGLMAIFKSAFLFVHHWYCSLHYKLIKKQTVWTTAVHNHKSVQTLKVMILTLVFNYSFSFFIPHFLLNVLFIFITTLHVIILHLLSWKNKTCECGVITKVDPCLPLSRRFCESPVFICVSVCEQWFCALVCMSVLQEIILQSLKIWLMLSLVPLPI